MNMKRYNGVACGLAVAMLLSCSDYLKDESGDLLIPKKVDEYQSVLYGEGYPNSFTSDVEWMDLMTDDVEISTGAVPENTNGAEGDDTNNLPAGRGAFCWAYDIEYYLTNYGNAYLNRYKNIRACNIVIEAGESMMGDKDKVDACLAEAYTLRAFNYLCLVNWYGMPYCQATAANDLGVVLRLKSEVIRDEPKRASVAQVYAQINSDLDKALTYFETAKTSKSQFVVTKRVAQLLKSRVALYTGQWDEAIAYGNLVGVEGWNLYNVGKLTAAEMMNYKTDWNFLTSANTEIIFTYGSSSNYSTHSFMEYAGMLKGASFVPSQSKEGDLIRCYEEGDNRLYAFFMQNYIDYDEDWDFYWDYIDYRKIPFKHYGYASSTQCYSQVFRTAEALLNVAEAYVQRNQGTDCEQAIELLNTLRQNRFTAEKYRALTLADFDSTADLLTFVRDERRRELCFEETHRWNDLRRYGMPRIEHTYYSDGSAAPEVFVLEEGDRNYTLALPKYETSYNTQIEIYDRRVIDAK